MPEISRFFGIIIRMFFDEHDPPHFHAEYQGSKGVFDFYYQRKLEFQNSNETSQRVDRFTAWRSSG